MAPAATEPGADAIYRAGRQAALLVETAGRGRLRLTGAARQGLLHRITTGDIKALAPGRGGPTLLVTGKGRILDRLAVLCRADDLLVLTSEGTGERSREMIRKYVVFEDVQVHDETAATFLLALHGARAADVLAAATGGPVDLAPYAHRPVRLGDLDVTLAREPGFGGGAAWLVLGPAAGCEAARQRLLAAGEPHGIVAAGETRAGSAAGPGAAAALEALRIEAGLPAAGHELDEAYNPLEMRQEDALSFDKGCYVGQEVIARLRTYDKVRRQLVRLEVAGSEPVAAGAAVRGAHGEGVITSAAPVPGAGRWVALAVLPAEGGAQGEVEIETPAGPREATLAGPPPTARDVRVAPPKPPAPGKRRFGS